MKLKVELYERLDGTSPIKEFILGLPEKAQAKVYGTFLLLEGYGLGIGMPYVKHLSGFKGVWELRVKCDGEIYRFPFFINKGIVMILHAFHKKTQKIQKKELKLISNRLKELS
jgi:phage-related protein